MAVKERGCIERGRGRERHAWNVKGRLHANPCVDGRTRKSRGSLTSQILITCDRPRILVRVTRPYGRGYTRENSVVYIRIYTPDYVNPCSRDEISGRSGRSGLRKRITKRHENFRVILSNSRREKFILKDRLQVCYRICHS